MVERVVNERRQERAAAQVELFEHLLSTLGGADDFEPTRIDRTRQTQSRFRRRRPHLWNSSGESALHRLPARCRATLGKSWRREAV